MEKQDRWSVAFHVTHELAAWYGDVELGHIHRVEATGLPSSSEQSSANRSRGCDAAYGRYGVSGCGFGLFLAPAELGVV